MLRLLREAGHLPPHGEPDAETFAAAADAFLASTASAVALVQLDDLMAETEPVNVPSTVDEYPNWRRRHRLRLDELEAVPPVALRLFASVRGRNSDSTERVDSARDPEVPPTGAPAPADPRINRGRTL